MIVVVMGVCGCGKTTIGRMLAERLDAAFIEGDELHPFANKDKMTAGMPLEDADREPWLDAIAAKATQLLSRAPCVVVSCSALKRAYRDRLRTAGENLHLVHLTGAESLLQARMIEAARSFHAGRPAGQSACHPAGARGRRDGRQSGHRRTTGRSLLRLHLHS